MKTAGSFIAAHRDVLPTIKKSMTSVQFAKQAIDLMSHCLKPLV